MDKLVIEGGVPLKGKVRISGSKNAALPILLPRPSSRARCVSNVPDLRDIATTLKLLELLGCRAVQRRGRAAAIVRPEARSALRPGARPCAPRCCCLGPLLARLGRARVAMPGGCAIGARPVDLHLKGLEQMGAVFELESGDIIGTCDRLQGAHIQLRLPHRGRHRAPDHGRDAGRGRDRAGERGPRAGDPGSGGISEHAAGRGSPAHGTSVVRIEGVESLHGCSYPVMPDRIEAGTYLVAAGMHQGRADPRGTARWTRLTP